MSRSERVILIDGSWLIHRAYFTVPANLQTRSGVRTNAVLGVADALRRLWAEFRPSHGAVLFDAPGPLLRAEQYPEYRANRLAMPAELAAQLPLIERLIGAYRCPTLAAAGYESRDAIGTLTRQALAAGLSVLIVSGNKGFAQLVGEHVRVYDVLRDLAHDLDSVAQKWGVRPSQVVDLLALMGDPSDNVPGVPGIGLKGASVLLDRYGSLEGIYTHLDTLKGRQRESLTQHRRRAYLSRALVAIHQQVPLARDVHTLVLPPPVSAELNTLYREFELYALLTHELVPDAVDGAPPHLAWAGEPLGVRLIEHPEAAATAEIVAALGRQPLVALVPLFDPPSAIHGTPLGLALVAPGQRCYIPLGSGRGAQMLAPFAAWLAEPRAAKVAHNVKEVWQLCRRHGYLLDGVVGDTMLTSFLLESIRLAPHRLDQVAREYLHHTVRPLKAVLGAGPSERRLRDLPVAVLADYATELADAVLRLWPILAERLTEQRLHTLLVEHELRLAVVLGQMELDGIAADVHELGRIADELALRKADVERKIYALAGREFSLVSTQQLAQVLFKELQLPMLKRTKTGYSTDAQVLEQLAQEHEIARQLLAYRMLARLINTDTEGLRKAVHPRTGRIHATFHQTQSPLGQLAAVDPDLQRPPLRSAEGRRLRQAFVAAPQHLLIAVGWAQIELRMLAHLSGDPALVALFHERADVHRHTAAALYDCLREEVTQTQRAVAKTVSFSALDGHDAATLARNLGLSTAAAQRHLDRFFARYVGVRRWREQCLVAARQTRAVTTLLGRRRQIPELASKRESERLVGERIALHTAIRGSTADLYKQAMLAIAQTLKEHRMQSRLLVQLQDELLLEAPMTEMDHTTVLVRTAMENVHPLAVPLVLEVGRGRTWSEARYSGA